MPRPRRDAVLTYNGVDGACAAAALLLVQPDAELRITSAKVVGFALAKLADERRVYDCVHICGLGIACPWDELNAAAAALKEKGTTIRWYCGRGYLDKHRESIEAIGTALFETLGTNTAASNMTQWTGTDNGGFGTGNGNLGGFGNGLNFLGGTFGNLQGTGSEFRSN